LMRGWSGEVNFRVIQTMTPHSRLATPRSLIINCFIRRCDNGALR
jgi:hypothetical protein